MYEVQKLYFSKLDLKEEKKFVRMSMKTFVILKDSSLGEMFSCQILGNTYSNLANVVEVGWWRHPCISTVMPRNKDLMALKTIFSAGILKKLLCEFLRISEIKSRVRCIASEATLWN